MIPVEKSRDISGWWLAEKQTIAPGDTIPPFPLFTEPACEGRTYTKEEWEAMGGPYLGVGSDDASQEMP